MSERLELPRELTRMFDHSTFPELLQTCGLRFRKSVVTTIEDGASSTAIEGRINSAFALLEFRSQETVDNKSYLRIDLHEGFYELSTERQAVALAIALQDSIEPQVYLSFPQTFTRLNGDSSSMIDETEKSVKDFVKNEPGNRYSALLKILFDVTSTEGIN